MQISILIPTYNRRQDLIDNLHALCSELTKDGLWPHYEIIVSDNASDDGTQEALHVFSQSGQAPSDKLKLHRNAQNIGLEANAVQVLSLSQADYVLFLGDDDYLASGYLQAVSQRLQAPNPPKAFITGIYEVDQNLEILKDCRPCDFETKKIEAGYQGLWEASHLGNQLSGLVLRRQGLLERYLAQPSYRNPYLFIYLLADCLWEGGGEYWPKFKTKVKVLNAKDWSYNGIGLLDEVYKSYYYFLDKVSPEQLGELLLRFTRLHAHRFGIRAGRPFALVGQHKQILAALPPSLRFLYKPLAVLMFKEYLLACKRKIV